MSEPSPSVVSRRTAEILFAAMTALFGGVVMWGALEHDIGWTRSGPEAGYFPFRVGLVITVVSLLLIAGQVLKPAAGALLTRDAVPGLVRFAAPLAVFVALVPWLGLYLAGALYLLVAIGIAGRIAWQTTLALAAAVPVVVFLVFEYVFVVPLPKGPLGPLLGLL